MIPETQLQGGLDLVCVRNNKHVIESTRCRRDQTSRATSLSEARQVNVSANLAGI